MGSGNPHTMLRQKADKTTRIPAPSQGFVSDIRCKTVSIFTTFSIINSNAFHESRSGWGTEAAVAFMQNSRSYLFFQVPQCVCACV